MKSKLTTFLGALRSAFGARKALSAVSDWRSGWRRIQEAFTGAWQRNIEETQGDLTGYPTLYACLNRIATDIGKLPFKVVERQENGVWKVVDRAAYGPVLRKPNHFQNGAQFRVQWALSRLQHGNVYVLKERDARNVVVRLYILDPCRVLPMISETGEVFYQVMLDTPSLVKPQGYAGREGTIIIPAREIIHDRAITLHHPLIGVPPLCAAYWPAVKNLKILKDATTFFANGARPGGILTAPADMSEEDAKAVKSYWDDSFSGDNAGKVGVIGADMKFTPFAFKSADSQLVEQLRYSDEQICQPFGIPPFKIGIGSIPAGMKVDDINQLYYSDALQALIEDMEWSLDEGLQVTAPLGIELDLEPLLRMDPMKQAEFHTKLIGGGVETPNEGRLPFNLAPLEGGDTVYMQQQDYPLDQVRLNRIAPPVPVAIEDPEPDPDPEAEAEAEEAARAALESAKRLEQIERQLWMMNAVTAARTEAIQ